MTTSANADLVADALLRYYLNPAQHRMQMLQPNEAMGNLDLVVRFALGKPVESCDAALHQRYDARELANAALFFIKQVLFRDGSSHYQILGLSSDASSEAIRENHRLLIQVVHPDRRSSGLVWSETIAARVNRAYSVLKNAETRTAYDTAEADERNKLAQTRSPHRAPRMPKGNVVFHRSAPEPVFLAWMSAGVGGFIRQYPAFTIFTVLIFICATIIGGVMWSEREGVLARYEGAEKLRDPVAVSDIEEVRSIAKGKAVVVAQAATVRPMVSRSIEVVPASPRATHSAVAPGTASAGGLHQSAATPFQRSSPATSNRNPAEAPAVPAIAPLLAAERQNSVVRPGDRTIISRLIQQVRD